MKRWAMLSIGMAVLVVTGTWSYSGWGQVILGGSLAVKRELFAMPEKLMEHRLHELSLL